MLWNASRYNRNTVQCPPDISRPLFLTQLTKDTHSSPDRARYGCLSVWGRSVTDVLRLCSIVPFCVAIYRESKVSKCIIISILKFLYDVYKCTPTPIHKHTPDQSMYHARTQVWKSPPFRGFWTKKNPFATEIAGFEANETPLLSKTRFFS